MALGSSIYKLTFDSNATKSLTATRREVSLVKKIMEESVSPAEKYEQSVKVLERMFAKTDMTTEQLAHGMKAIEAEHPKMIRQAELHTKAEKARADELRRGAAMTRAMETETERYERELASTERTIRRGGPHVEAYRRKLVALKTSFKANSVQQRRMTAAMREGRTLTKSLETAEERRAAELRRTQRLLRQGAISQATYNRSLKRARLEQMSSIPVVGNLTSRFAGIHPVTIAAGVSLAALAVEMRVVFGAARALTGAVKEQFSEIDDLAKSARKLGGSVDDMFAMSVAAKEISGVEFSQFETALQRMTRRVAEAAAGGGEAQAAIKELGLEAKELNLAGPTGAFEMFADSFGEIDDAGKRLRLAFKLFDSEGAVLVSTLAGGSAGLREYRREMIELGALPSPFDAAAIEPMNDAFNRAGLVVDGITRDLAVGLAPTLTAIAEEVVDALKPGSQIGNDIRFAFSTIPPAIAAAADATNVMIGHFQLAQVSVMKMRGVVVDSFAAIDRAMAAASPFKSENEELQFMAQDFARQTTLREKDALKRLGEGMAGSIQERVKELRAEIAAAAKEGPGESGVAGADNAAAEAAQKLTTDVDTLTASLQREIDTMGMSKFEVDRMGLAHRQAGDDVLGAADKLEQERQELEAFHKGADKFDSVFASLISQLETVGMTADELQLKDLADLGVGDTQIGAIEGLQTVLRLKKEFADEDKKAEAATKSLADDVTSYTAALEKQIATVGMSADETKRWELAQRGLVDTELEKIAALQEEARAHEDLAKAAGGSLGGSFSAMQVGSREAEEALAKGRATAQEDFHSPAALAESMDDIFGPPSGMTPPMSHPVTQQPSSDKATLDKQLTIQKKIEKNTAKPLVIEEVTLN